MDVRSGSQTEKKAYACLSQLWENGEKAALAIILEAKGSTPQVAGAAALISANGLIAGTVGGGSFEAAIIERCQHLLESGEAEVMKWTFSADGEEEGSLCGGEALILLDSTVEKDRPVLEKAIASTRARHRGLLLTAVKVSAAKTFFVRRYFLEEGSWQEEEILRSKLVELFEFIPFRPQVLEKWRDHLLEEEKPWLEAKEAATGEVWYLFYEPIIPAPRLLVFGAGHVGQAVAKLGVFLGYEVILFDDRADLSVPDNLMANLRFQSGDMAKNLSDFPTDEMSYAVIVTRGHRRDAAVLRVALEKGLAYIGMIGSRRKVALMREEFISSGWATPEKWEEVHSPIGLDIGAETVEEIAVSIMAEIIKLRRAKRKQG